MILSERTTDESPFGRAGSRKCFSATGESSQCEQQNRFASIGLRFVTAPQTKRWQLVFRGRVSLAPVPELPSPPRRPCAGRPYQIGEKHHRTLLPRRERLAWGSQEHLGDEPCSCCINQPRAPPQLHAVRGDIRASSDVMSATGDIGRPPELVGHGIGEPVGDFLDGVERAGLLGRVGLRGAGAAGRRLGPPRPERARFAADHLGRKGSWNGMWCVHALNVYGR